LKKISSHVIYKCFWSITGLPNRALSKTDATHPKLARLALANICYWQSLAMVKQAHYFFPPSELFLLFFQLNRRVGATTALAELENREACPRPLDITGDEKLI
jgi:hypothetical protein